MSANKQSPSWVPILMVGLGIVIMVFSVVWFIGSTTRESVVDFPATSTPTVALNIPYPNVQRITPAEAKAALDQKQAVFIDTRGEPYFSQGHIPGAIPMTSDEVLSRLVELDPNGWIITYCT